MYLAEYHAKARIEELRAEAKRDRIARTLAQQNPKPTFLSKIKVVLKRRFRWRLSKT